MDNLVYKICDRTLWAEAEKSGTFKGAAIDLADGFIHFSTAAQVEQTAELHFAGVSDLILAAIDVSALGNSLRFEPSRGGDLFPHLYEDLSMSAVVWSNPLPLGDEQLHVFPDLRTGLSI